MCGRFNDFAFAKRASLPHGARCKVMGIFDKIAEWLMPGAAQPAFSLANTPEGQSLAAQSLAAEPRAAEASEEVSAVPAQLPKIAATTAMEVCMECDLEPAAMKLLRQEQTPAQYLALLQDGSLGSDMVKVLAEGMPDREGVAWAVRCAMKVVDKLPLADVRALKAAEAWLKHPTREAQIAAGAAALRTEFQSPGAWAAQAAASARAGGQTLDPGATDEEDAPRLTPKAVAGAVMLSTAVLAVPAYGTRLLDMLQAGAAAAAGMALAGASSRLQTPSMGGLPAVPSLPNVSVPQLPGMTGKIQAGLGSMPNVGETGNIGLQIPGVAGAMASPAGAVAQGAMSGGGAGAMAAALGSVPVLRGASAAADGMAITVPGVSAMANFAASNPQVPALANPSLPNVSLPDRQQSQPPTPPAPEPVSVFRGQRPFIEIGLGIASGKISID